MIIRSRQARQMRGANRGFTLIEVIIVVVIVGILAMVALPTYQNSVRKGLRSDAKVGLLSVAGRMEQYILDRGSYTYNMQQLGFDADPMVTEEGHYTIDAAACTDGSVATCYELTATPRATSPQADDADCKKLMLSYTGAKTATGDDDESCWN